MSEVELREQIAEAKANINIQLPDYKETPLWQKDLKFADYILYLIKEAGYLPVEPVQLEVLGEKEIRYKLELIQPEGFNWADATETEMIKFKAISQANNTHNEAKGQLYREVQHE